MEFKNLRDYLHESGMSNAAFARKFKVCDRLVGQLKKPENPTAVVAKTVNGEFALYQMSRKEKLSGRVVELLAFREYMNSIRWKTQFAARELKTAKTIPAIKCSMIDKTFVGVFESGEKRLFSRPARRKVSNDKQAATRTLGATWFGSQSQPDNGK